ncbi:MAG: FtsX-like permease family protein [Eubacteriales bacterium]
MQLRDIALKNLRRRKSKMMFLVLGMVFGVATIVTLFSLTKAMEHSVNRKNEETGLKLAVVPKTETASFSVGGIPVVTGISYDVRDLPADTVQKIRSVPGADKIKVVAPKVMGTAVLNGSKTLLVGVDFPSELKIKSWWEFSGNLPQRKDEALVGSAVAGRVKASVGQTADINGRVLKVSGVLKETGEDEDGIVFVSIDTARNILARDDKYSFIEITTVKDEAAAAGISKEILQKLPEARVKVVKEAAEARQELVERFSKFSFVVSLVMVVIASLIIMTTMTASVNERTREIGIFRAIGFRQSHITKIIVMEAAVICGITGLAGYLTGMVAAFMMAPLFSGFRLVISWNPFLGTAVLTGAVLLGVLASLYPATRAAKLDPAEALRFI